MKNYNQGYFQDQNDINIGRLFIGAFGLVIVFWIITMGILIWS